jgi:hypothetical protein
MATTPPQAQETVLSILPIVVSTIAIFVTLANAAFTAYLQYFRRPKLQLIVSKWARTWLLADEHLAFNIAITFVNSGAQYATVTSVTGKLTNSSTGETIDIQWSKFIEFENSSKTGEAFTPHGSFAGWADYLVVPNRQAVAQTIQFVSSQPFTAQEASYRLALFAHSGTGARSSLVAETEVVFRVSAEKSEKLKITRVDAANGVSKGSVSFATAHAPR